MPRRAIQDFEERRENEDQMKLFASICERIGIGFKAKSGKTDPTAKASEANQKTKKQFHVPNRGPYNNKRNPRVCIKCGEPLSRKSLGKPICLGYEKGTR